MKCSRTDAYWRLWQNVWKTYANKEVYLLWLLFLLTCQSVSIKLYFQRSRGVLRSLFLDDSFWPRLSILLPFYVTVSFNTGVIIFFLLSVKSSILGILHYSNVLISYVIESFFTTVFLNVGHSAVPVTCIISTVSVIVLYTCTIIIWFTYYYHIRVPKVLSNLM